MAMYFGMVFADSTRMANRVRHHVKVARVNETTTNIMSKRQPVKEMHYAFQLSRTEIYEVHIRPNMVSNNGPAGPYIQDGFDFSTMAEVFNRPKTDFNTCGQCQERVTANYPAANAHWKKWDQYHLKRVTPELFDEWLKDIEELKAAYDYIEQDREISFSQLRELSMEKVKKQPKK
jgi:hypothetical protein